MISLLKKYYLDPFLNLPKLSWVLCFGALLNSIGRVAIPFFTIFSGEEYGITFNTSGYLLGIYGAGNLLGSYFGGILCDRFSGQNTLKFSLLLAGIGFLGITLFHSIYWLASVLFFIAFFESWYRPAFNVCVADLFQEKDRTQVLSLYRTMINLGFSIGAASSMWVASLGGWDALCLVDGLSSIVAVLFIHFLVPKSNVKNSVKKGLFSLEPFYNIRFNYLFGGMLLVGFVFFQLKSTIPAYFAAMGLSKEWFATLLSLNGFIVVFLELPLNSFLRNYSRLKVVMIGILFLGFGLIICTVTESFTLSIICLAIWTIGEIMVFPVVISLIIAMTSKENIGMYMGSYQLIFSLSSITAPILGFFIFSSLGPGTLWIMCCFATVFAVGLIGKSQQSNVL